MTRFAVYCKDTVAILGYIRAVDPCLAFKLASEQFPGINIQVCYAEDDTCLA